MSRKAKVKLVKGGPIHLDFVIEGEVISYEMVCPMCQTETFVFSIDKEMGGCTNPNCPCVLLYRLKTKADMSKVQWNIPGAGK